MTLSCGELAGLIYDFVEESLPADRSGWVRVHIEGCPSCEVYVESYRHTVRLTKRLPRCNPLPPAFADRLAVALKEHLAAPAAE